MPRCTTVPRFSPGDAGQGESNIRRWIIENDWLEAIIALPLNIFYNTRIATDIWVLTNRKPAHRRGRVQLIDATGWYQPLRKNLGKKNCELSEADIQRICDMFMAFEETEQSQVFPNEAFGYWKVTVERPLRLRVDLNAHARDVFPAACDAAGEVPLANLIDRAKARLGAGPHLDYDAFMAALGEMADQSGVKLTAKRQKLLHGSLATRDENAAPVLRWCTSRVKPRPIRSVGSMKGQLTESHAL